jgi:hypothetical protein
MIYGRQTPSTQRQEISLHRLPQKGGMNDAQISQRLWKRLYETWVMLHRLLRQWQAGV